MGAVYLRVRVHGGEVLTCPGFEELKRDSGCMVASGDTPKRGVDDCESGEAFILSLRRDDGADAPAVIARDRFFGGCSRLGFMVPSDESCIKQSTAPSASSSMSVDCTCCSAAAAAARLGELGWSAGTASFASGTETGSWQTGSELQSALAADRLSKERSFDTLFSTWAMGCGVTSSGPSMRTKPVCICQRRARSSAKLGRATTSPAQGTSGGYNLNQTTTLQAR